MKWTNKGHEFDDVYKVIKEKKTYFLFGAGDYGRQFLEIFRKEIFIGAFIDNDEKKQSVQIESLGCISFDNYFETRNNEDGIIVTMSQIARISAIEQLEKKGLQRNNDFFVMEDFLSIYFVYKKDMIFFSSISFLPSTICNLECKHCLNFNPYAKQFYVREWNDLIRDVDLFFSCVDKVMLFHVSGGEPLLYQHTADLIQYIDMNYRENIGTLRTVTNGTVVPQEEILQVLAECNVEVTVDDYRDSVPRFSDNFDRLIVKLNAYGIKYYINKADSWIDLAPDRTDYSEQTEEWLINHRDNCNQSWQELRDGKLYSCNYAAYATVAGIAGDQDIEEVFDLKSYTPDKMMELVEFRLGYTSKGYTNFCKTCRGFTPDNNIAEVPAEQM